MAFLYLDESSIFDAFRDSEAYMRPYFEPVNEYERIARNKPHSNIPKNYPRVTDGTTSSVIQKSPRRIIQQLPTGSVVSDVNDWVSIVASFIYTNKIIPNANDQFALLQKCWHLVKSGLTVGAAHGYVPFVNRGDYFGTDLRIPYVKDVYFEPGKLSDLDSNFIFLRSWFQPRDIDAIIWRENKLAGFKRSRNEPYESTWNLKELQAIRNEVVQKPQEQQSNGEQRRDTTGHKGGVEIIHAFQRGKGGKFYSIHVKSGKILRTKTNKDPRGELPLNSFYADTDGHNPLGWGIVEQVGPLQDLMDSEMQMYQFNRALQLAPPMIKRGNWNKAQMRLVPNAVWDLGTNKENSADPLKIDTSALQNFPEIYGLMKSQLLNLTASPDTSISASVGNPGFSKTDAGVNQIQANVSVDDNFVRKQFETWFANWSETAINLYFAERNGVQELQLDEETANKLRKLTDFDYDRLLDKNNKIRIDFDDATERLKFNVDASTSMTKDNNAQRDRLLELLEMTEKYGLGEKGLVNERELVDRIVVSSGVEDPEKIVPDEDTYKQQQEQIAQQQAQAAQPTEQATPPSKSISYKDAPEDIKRQLEQQAGMEPSQMISPVQQAADQKQQQLDQAAAKANQPDSKPSVASENEQVSQDLPDEMDDETFITGLRNLGYSDHKIGQALAMTERGMSQEEIIEMLEASNGQ